MPETKSPFDRPAVKNALQAAALLLPWVFIARFADAFLWASAVHASAKRKFEKALRLARSMRVKCRERIDWRVFEIQQLTLLKRNEEAVEAVNQFLLHYSFPTPATSDRAYLLAFAKWCGQVAFDRYAPDSPVPSAFLFEASEIALRDVRERYKRNFPLVLHPAWSPSSPFHESRTVLGLPRTSRTQEDAQSVLTQRQQ